MGYISVLSNSHSNSSIFIFEVQYGAQTTAENATVQGILCWWPDMNANICTVTVNASLTLYSASVAYFCDSVTLIYACIIIIIIMVFHIVSSTYFLKLSWQNKDTICDTFTKSNLYMPPLNLKSYRRRTWLHCQFSKVIIIYRSNAWLVWHPGLAKKIVTRYSACSGNK